MFKNKYAKSGSKGGRPKTPSVDDDEEEAEIQRVRVAVANTRNQVCLISYCFSFFDNLFICKILTIRHHRQEQELSVIQALKCLPVLAAHLLLQGLAAHLYPPLAHRRQAGGHELPAVCQTNGETKFGGAYWHKTKQIRCGKIEEVELNLNCRTRK